MFSKDIRIRLKNGQIKLNGETIKEDIEITDVTMEMVEEDEDLFDQTVMGAGDFIFKGICNDPIWVLRCKIFGFENLFNSNIENELTDFLDMFNVLKISKKDYLVIQK